MKTSNLHEKRALRTALLVLLLSLVGMTKLYAQIIGDLRYSLDKNTLTATVTGHKDGTNATGNLIIPSSVTYTSYEWVNGQQIPVTRTYTVTKIGIDAFLNCGGLTGSLIIPNTVTEIADEAFECCRGFTGNLTIGNSVTTIGGDAFYGCSGFTGSLIIPNSVTWIDVAAFSGCSGFTGSLTLSNSLTSISNLAFWGCSGFTGSLIIPNSVTSIGNYAFRDCTGFTGDLIIPNSVTLIGSDAFKSCSGFNGNLILGNSVATIGYGAFEDCSGFIGPLTIPNSMVEISDRAFIFCSGFSGDLIIPNSVTRIGNAAFAHCTGLNGTLTLPDNELYTRIESSSFYDCPGFIGNLIIPNSVSLIEGYAFADCSNLISVTIPNSVTNIYYNVFDNCIGFTFMTVLAETPPSILFGGAFQKVPKDIPVFVPCHSIDEYQTAYNWSEFTNYVDDFPFNLMVESIDPEHCTVSIVQHPTCDDSHAIVKAEPAAGYVFVAWEEDGMVVSNDMVYTLTVDHDMHLFARVRSNTGVSEGIEESFAVYPNPSQGYVTVEGTGTLTIANTLGQTIMTKEIEGKTKMELPQGLYFVTLGGETRKIVVE